VKEYLTDYGLLEYLESLKFNIVGYGCGPCIGNSGPLARDIVDEIKINNLTVSSVSSGNRNFEGRISPHTKTNYLASPPLVIAFALAGTTMIDFRKDPIGKSEKGENIFLKDLWPTTIEIKAITDKYVTAKTFLKGYENVEEGTTHWKEVEAEKSDLYQWNDESTYIQEPPFFLVSNEAFNLNGSQILVKVGNSITTDHISPAGVIAEESPAGIYLKECGIEPENFNSYGSRRGNDRVMTRGTFANIRLRNQLVPGTEGSWTFHFPSKKMMSIFDAAEKYKEENIPLIIIAGKEYGTGSSRDWAAKGTSLLGVKAVLAESFERIHRSNLAGMGIIPLEFVEGQSSQTLEIQGDETFDFEGINENLQPRQTITVKCTSPSGNVTTFKMIVRLDTPVEIEYVRNGGILQTVMKALI